MILNNQDDMDTSSDKTEHIPTHTKLQKNINKITPDFNSLKLKNQSTRTGNHDEDDKSIVSSSSIESNKDKGDTFNKNSEGKIKDERRSLRIKQKQERLNKR